MCVYAVAWACRWIGGQAEYVMVPYADWNCLVLPGPRERILDHILSLTCLSDILPTGYHGAVSAGVTTGSSVYVAGAGPVGLACAAACQLLGAGVVVVGDMNKDRLAQARKFGCQTVDLTEATPLPEQLRRLVGAPEVDCAVDCVGFEARGCGHDHTREQPATVLNQMMAVCKAGGAIGIPGLYVTEDPGAVDSAARLGNLSLRIGLGWAKSHVLVTGQCPVMRYNKKLMNAILNGKIDAAAAVNVHVIGLDDAPNGYKDFDKGALPIARSRYVCASMLVYLHSHMSQICSIRICMCCVLYWMTNCCERACAGAAKKFVIDPHGIVRAHMDKKKQQPPHA